MYVCDNWLASKCMYTTNENTFTGTSDLYFGEYLQVTQCINLYVVKYTRECILLIV